MIQGPIPPLTHSSSSLDSFRRYYCCWDMGVNDPRPQETKFWGEKAWLGATSYDGNRLSKRKETQRKGEKDRGLVKRRGENITVVSGWDEKEEYQVGMCGRTESERVFPEPHQPRMGHVPWMIKDWGPVDWEDAFWDPRTQRDKSVIFFSSPAATSSIKCA